MVHGLAVAGALVLMAQMRPLPTKEVFRWEVALVQPMAQEQREEQIEPNRPAASSTPARPVPSIQPTKPISQPSPEIVTRQAKTIEQSNVIQREPQRVVERTQPTERRTTPQQREQAMIQREPATQGQVVERPAEQVLQSVPEQQEIVAENRQSVTRPAPMTSAERVEVSSAVQPALSPVQSTEPVEAPSAVQRVREEPVLRNEPVTVPSQEAVVHSPASTAVEPPKPTEQPTATADAPLATQLAKLAPNPAPPVSAPKADHRWVGESLWRRVAEVKRYPNAARLNGLEGRVVLKAVIRADGQLAEVRVLKSSGHAILDEAAMEAVRLACPLKMKEPIGPPQIVVSLPIVYSLAN